MRKVLTISIPKPCHEDWNTMSLQDKGRHCSVCNKTVFDFTNTTDEHLIKTFEQKENLCGRFKPSQLNREIVLSRKNKNSYMSLVASSLFAFLSIGTQDVNAQGEPIVVQLDSTSINSVKGKLATSILNKSLISGTVVSAEDGLPLPGVTIVIKGTPIGAQTDFDGNYSIKVKRGDSLVFSLIGLLEQEIKVSNSRKINVNLVMSEEMLGEVVVVGGAIGYETRFPTPPTPEEQLEKAKQRKFNKENNFKFYKRKHLEERLLQKQKRQKVKNGELERTAIGKFLYKMTNVFRKKE